MPVATTRKVQALRRDFKTGAAVADLLGVSRSQITRWLKALPLDRYVSLFEMLNPMHRLWSDGRWNKLTVAHGVSNVSVDSSCGTRPMRERAARKLRTMS